MKLSLLFVSMVACFPLALVGCAADALDAAGGSDTSIDQALSGAGLVPGTFVLSTEPHHQLNPACDTHTIIELRRVGGATASLHEEVTGTCKVAVNSNFRTYELGPPRTSCGSNIYKARPKRIDGVERTLVVTDHRARTCQDLVRAEIIVEETGRSGASQVKFSLN